MSKVICLDLEMNAKPSGKIIQLGYVIADLASKKIFLKKRIYINPNEPLGFMPDLKINISEYTGITEDHISKYGVSLEQAYKEMCEDIKKHNATTTCLQWGDGSGDSKGDHDYLRKELSLSWEDFIFRPRVWDIKSLFQFYRASNNKGVVAGVVKALESLNLSFEGRPHDALDDAYNTLKIAFAISDKMSRSDKIEKIFK